MKKFFRIGKDKRDKSQDRVSQSVRSKSGTSASHTSRRGQESPQPQGYDIKEKDLAKLHKAVWNGDLHKVKQLAKKDASPFDKEHRTPLHLACARGHHLIVKELLEWNAKVNVGDSDARTPIMKAVECQQEDCVSLLLEDKADPNAKDKAGQTCLHYAAREGLVQIIRVLTSSEKTDIDVRDQKGNTPLHISVMARQSESCDLLLGEGAEPNIQNSQGRTPMMLAADQGSADIIQLLLRSGADRTIKEKNGWTADDIAIMQSHDECHQLLQGLSPSHSGQKKAPSSTGAEQKLPEYMPGGPAVDEGDDYSDPEDTESAGGHLDSWAESEEDFELDTLKKKKQSGVSLTKVLSDVQEEDSITGIEATNAIVKKVEPSMPPVSARSTHSQLSMAEADSVWSDGEEGSLFSSGDANKPTLAQLHKNAQSQPRSGPIPVQPTLSSESKDDWDDESSTLSPRRQEKKGVSLVSGALGRQDAVEVPEPQKKELTVKERIKELVKDLGLSSVSGESDLSDPDLSDVELPPSKPPTSMENKKPPVSARSSTWDSSVDDDEGIDKHPTSARQPMEQLEVPLLSSLKSGLITPPSAFQSRESLHRLKELEQLGENPLRASQDSVIVTGLDSLVEEHPGQPEEDNWDSGESELATSPRKDDISESIEIEKVSAANKPEVIIEEDSGATNEPTPQKSAAVQQKEEAEENSDWDSESEMVSDPRQTDLMNQAKTSAAVLPNVPPPVGKEGIKLGRGQMYGDSEEEEDEEEEEEESTWEKERRMAKLQKQNAQVSQKPATPRIVEDLSDAEEEVLSKEEDRNKQWQQEWERKQEQMRREAQEELRREQEEQEKLQRMSDEDDDDIEDLLKPSAAAGGILSPVHEEITEQVVKSSAAQQQNVMQNNSASSTPKQQGPPCIESSGEEEEADVEEEKERSRQLRLRREQAEKELEEAKKRQFPAPTNQNKAGRKGKMNVSFDDEDDDTFNDLEVIGMDSPRKEGLVRRSEEDGLSYSSTEHEVSQHQDMETALTKQSDHYTQQTSESLALVRLQEQLRDCQKRLEKERSTRSTLENKRKTLEIERSDLTSKLEETMRAKSSLEQTKIDLDAKIRSLQYQLSEEVEKRSNAEVLYNKARDQLNRKEDQYTGEIEEKQKTELTVRNLQMELRAALSQAKQSAEEKEDLERQLQHERNARLLQEQINEEQQRFQHSLHEDTSQISAEAISRLEATDEDRKHALDTSEKLKAELYAVKMELERQRSRGKDELEMLGVENEELHSKIEEYKQDLQLNEDALRQYTINNTVELSRVKTDKEKLGSLLDKEKAMREKSDTELESLRTRLESTVTELQREQQARSDLERSSQRDREEWSRMIERRETEVNHLKDSNQSQEQRNRDQESKLVRMENELAVANATLVERTSQLTTIQKELEQRRGNQSNMEELLRKEKEENARLQAKSESLADQVTSLRHETLTLRTQLDEARVSGMKGDTADNFTNILNTLRADQEKTQSALQEKNISLSESLSRVNEQLRSSESQRNSLEQELRRLQSEVSDIHRKCSVAEASLEVSNRVREQTESERSQLRLEVDKLQTRLEDTKDRYMESQRKMSDLTERAERAEREALTSSQQYQNQVTHLQSLGHSKDGNLNRSELEDTLHKLEIENARLEAALKHERQRVESLQKELTDSHQSYLKVQEEIGEVRATNTELMFQRNEATATKSLAAHEAEDAKQMWETEVKSRSKLGLRMAQVEREKQDAVALAEEEKRKTKKALELKKVAETQLEEEKNKNAQLQKEVQTLKSHLKAAKKKLKTPGSLNGGADNKDLENMRSELEARSKWEVSQKLSEVNAYLQSQAQQQDRLYRMQETNEAELRRDFEKTRKELLEELARVRASYEQSLNDKANQERESKRLRDLYDNEVKMREKLMSRLEKANIQAHQAAALAERQQFRGSGGLPLDSSYTYNNAWTLGKSTTDHGINDLTHKIRQELDKSIARHLEKGPHIDISVPPHTSYDDSTAHLSSLDRARADYMSTMKRNYFV